MTHRVGAKGQVVIPKELRESAGLHPGTEVDFALDERAILVKPAGTSGAVLGGRFRGSNMAAELLEDRRREPR